MRLPIPLRRLGYRLAYGGLRVYWFFRRPQLSGVKCVLTDRDEVLLVRHTYGPRVWDLPGGAIKRGEPPVGAARREMAEELGVSIDDWRSLGAVAVTVDHRTDHVHCFQAEAPRRDLTLDRGEIADAAWFPRTGLPSDLGRYAGRIITRVPAPEG
ncbi:MAG TPA: NUDIX domain-containing protein [Solirubrobacteraceae bacterium]|jgi:ADP-ribose pyrophosphatase YjhB (NUDIX family)